VAQRVCFLFSIRIRICFFFVFRRPVPLFLPIRLSLASILQTMPGAKLRKERVARSSGCCTCLRRKVGHKHLFFFFFFFFLLAYKIAFLNYYIPYAALSLTCSPFGPKGKVRRDTTYLQQLQSPQSRLQLYSRPEDLHQQSPST
jgi:hypothetical protein